MVRAHLSTDPFACRKKRKPPRDPALDGAENGNGFSFCYKRAG